ncbi:TauD/TfdA family dioxygenase [Streptomyces sp. LHD-70]|uniref:TauD/TfdA family dioxygenase n=1 Tax=Streptomyces sp. LHD-70 TaxID=3072140 RepID=UPI00280FD66A|nr:TauD/TfdA family dioxygenase [Streptomyces sp. LHD-70]MDQ8703555.1 TauD/TfdA family dioxygenase [Streptomyces sp. LHD-70]
MLRHLLTGPSAWTGPDLAPATDGILHLSRAQLGEIESALRSVRLRGTPLLRVRPRDFPLPTLASELTRIADALENGRGFALIRGFPVDRYGPAAVSTLFWGLGLHLGVPVSQNAAGHLLGHVRDTGRSLNSASARGYQTREHLPFHTDHCDLLGLLCVRAAGSGGQISLAASASVHNGVLAQRPDLVDRLYRTHFVDRREEHGPGERPYHAVPLAAWHADRLSLRYHRRYLESAQRFPDVPRLEAADRELFDLIDALADSPQLRLDLDFAAGDLLLVNNHAVLHSRTAYEDSAEPALKRHVLRLWLTPHQQRLLPPGFWDESAAGRGRGGVAPRDVIGAAA